jgi:hypothetical protein
LRNSIEPGSIANQAGGSAADGSAGHLALVDATPAGVLAGQVHGGSATGTIAADLDSVKRKMLQRGKVENFDADDDKSGDSVGEEVPEKTKKKLKASAHTPMKKPAAAVTPSKVKEVVLKSVPDNWVKKPSIGWELSRSQIMCRTGRGGPSSSFRISIPEAGSKTAAKKKAGIWLEKQMKLFKARHCTCHTVIRYARTHICIIHVCVNRPTKSFYSGGPALKHDEVELGAISIGS